MPYLNTESLSVKFHTINSIEDSQKLLTVKLSAPSLLHAPPAPHSHNPYLQIMEATKGRGAAGSGEVALFNYPQDYEIGVRSQNANT